MKLEAKQRLQAADGAEIKQLKFKIQHTEQAISEAEKLGRKSQVDDLKKRLVVQKSRLKQLQEKK